MLDSHHYTFSSEQAILDRSTSPVSYIFAFPFLTNPSEEALYQTLACESFTCINGWYTVTMGVNDVLAINTTLLRIPEGFYTASSFCAAVQSLVRPVLGNAATVSYSSSTGRVTMASNSGYNFTVYSAPLTTAGNLLGMLPQITYSGFAEYTFERFLDLLPVKRILIASNLPSGNTDVGRNCHFIGSFPLTAPPLQLIEYDQKSFESVLPWNTSASQLRIQFYDQTGRGLEMASHFCLTLEHSIYMREPAPVRGFYDYLADMPALPMPPSAAQQEINDVDEPMAPEEDEAQQ